MAQVDKNPRRGYHTVTVDGIGEIDLLFSMRFWAFLEEEGYRLEDFEQHLSGGMVSQLKVISAIIASGGKTYARKHNTDFDYTSDDAYDWLEEDITQKDIDGLFAAMMSTKIFGNEINKNIDRAGKKMKAKK